MSKGNENLSSRDIILSRYQNVKSLLIAKNKLPQIKSEIRIPANKIQLKSACLVQEEEGAKATNILALYHKFQQKFKQKVVESCSYGVIKKTVCSILFVSIDSKTHRPLEKPPGLCLTITKSSRSLDFRCLTKPLISILSVASSKKSFKPIQKVYQMLEIHQQKSHASLQPTKPSSPAHAISSTSKPASSSLCSKTPTDFCMQSENSYKSLQLLHFKQQAKAKELKMTQRKQAAVKIQSTFRGWKQRKIFKPNLLKLQRKLTLKRLRVIADRIKILFAPYVICKALKTWAQYRQQEKLRLIKLFREYSAIYIQKCWKGYKTRQKLYKLILLRLFARSKIKGLLQGWKIRRILKCKFIQKTISELPKLRILYEELSEAKENMLLNQIENQIRMMKESIIDGIDKLYFDGSWTSVRNYSIDKNSEEEPSELLSQVFETNEPFILSRMSPIKDFEEETDEEQPKTEEKPIKVFKNFLRKGQNTKYDPKAAAKNKTNLTNELKEQKKIVAHPDAIQRKNTSCSSGYNFTSEKDLTSSGNNEDECLDAQKPRHNFLKRSSQTYKPKKLEWKAKTRVNCWGELTQSDTKTKKISKISSDISAISLSKIQEIEFVYDGILRNHVSASKLFRSAARVQSQSLIPQFLPESVFITDFTEEIYQETFELLQTHYLYLCNEDDLP